MRLLAGQAGQDRTSNVNHNNPLMSQHLPPALSLSLHSTFSSQFSLNFFALSSNLDNHGNPDGGGFKLRR